MTIEIDDLDKNIRLYLREMMQTNPKETMAFLLNKEFKMPYRKIAELMGSKLGTIRFQIHQGNERFLDFSKKNGIDDSPF